MPEEIRKAVVIGINEYTDPSIPKLSGAVNDATEIRNNLSRLGKFEITDDHFLINSRANAGAIRKAISDLLWKTDPCDIALFYFSGHGISDSYGNGYIAPFDMINNDPTVYGINMESELKQLMLRSLNKECVLLILDCCFSGISTKGEKAISEAAFSLGSCFGDLKTEGGGKIIIASSGEDQKSHEIELPIANGTGTLTHGVFSYHLLEGLNGKAADPSGIICLDKLFTYVCDQLQSKGRQKPNLFAAGTSQMDKIRITIESELFKKFIEEQLDQAKKNYSKNDIQCLIAAAVEVQSVLDSSNDNACALELQKGIQICLAAYVPSVMQWLNDNELDLYPKFSSAWEELEKVTPCLKEFNKVVSLNPRGRTQLSNLCRISRNEMEKELFIEKCRAWNNPSGGNKQS